MNVSSNKQSVTSNTYVKKNSCGFTLMELLVVMAVILFVGSIGLGILTYTLRGSNKTIALSNIKQNGNYAISQMSRNIRYAKAFKGVSNDDSSYSYCTSTSQQYKYLKITGYDGGTTIYACCSTLISSSSASPACTAPNTVPLIDITAVSYSSSSCAFTCSQQGDQDFPTIGISFTLSQRSTSAFSENRATINFKTTVTSRNSSK